MSSSILSRYGGQIADLHNQSIDMYSFSCSSDDAFFTDVQLARCVDSLSVLELVSNRFGLALCGRSDEATPTHPFFEAFG